MFKKILKNFSTRLKFTNCALQAALILGLTFTAENVTVQAAPYKSNSDTDIEIFDYIENQRRERRANQLTEEQKQLIADVEEKKEQLPHELDPNAPFPVAFEGDDLTYNAMTGEFIAVGKVDIIQLEGQRFQSEEIEGNVKEQEVRIPDKGHMLQMTPGAPRVTVDGYNTVYNYGTKTGTMESANGKMGEYYLSGKRFEFYPDHIVIYEATQTKCNAHVPDYHLSADRMEIYPEQIMRMYNVKFWIKNRLVGTKQYEERKLEDTGETYFPGIGYSSDHGVYIEDTFEIPLMPHLRGIINAHIETKKGVRSNAEIEYFNRELSSRIKYGFYYDSNGKWIQKKPSLLTTYSKHFPEGIPLTYRFKYEVGDWKSDTAASTHHEFEVGLSHDPIIIGGAYMLLLNTSYTITHDNVKSPEGRGNQTVKGMNYDIKLGREFDDRFAAFIGYTYNKNNSKNSLYEYNNDSYSSKFLAGISYKLTDKDRFVIGMKYNADDSKVEDIDYYWFRDLHCSTAVLRWRAKRHKWEVHWQFTPW